MNIIKEMEQGSDEWLSLRLGKVTASKMSDVLSKGRGTAPSKTAETYMMELLAERLTGESKPFFENDAMRWGTETEPQARFMYELKSGNKVEEVAFIERDEFTGVSPDGLIGDDGMIEIKCPTTITQIKRALTDDYSKDYYAQIQMQLWVAERQWCDFLSFDPRLDVDAGYLLQRVERDEEFIKNMEEKTAAFIAKMNEFYQILIK
jgi:putative phage-type endonuclease